MYVCVYVYGKYHVFPTCEKRLYNLADCIFFFMCVSLETRERERDREEFVPCVSHQKYERTSRRVFNETERRSESGEEWWWRCCIIYCSLFGYCAYSARNDFTVKMISCENDTTIARECHVKRRTVRVKCVVNLTELAFCLFYWFRS